MQDLCFIRYHLDYGDVVYDYPGNASFIQKIESVQYNASLAIAGCFLGTSWDKLYSELGFKSLADRWFYRRLIAFYKIVNKKAPEYLIDCLSTQYLASINFRKRPAVYTLDTRPERYRNIFSLLYLRMEQFGISHLLLLSNVLFLILYAISLYQCSR